MLLLDNMDGSFFSYKRLLHVLDGYVLRLPVKGSHVYANWDTIFITANEPPDTWYRYGLTPALDRRLTSVTELGNTIPTPEDALPADFSPLSALALRDEERVRLDYEVLPYAHVFGEDDENECRECEIGIG